MRIALVFLVLVLALCGIANAERHDDDDDDRPMQCFPNGYEDREEKGLKEADFPLRRPETPEQKKLDEGLPRGWKLFTRLSDLVVRGPAGEEVVFQTNISWTRARKEWKRVDKIQLKWAEKAMSELPTIDSTFDRPPVPDYPYVPDKPMCELGLRSVYEPTTRGAVIAKDLKKVRDVVARHCKRV